MPDTLPDNSVGLVTPQLLEFDEPLALECGHVLANFELMVETYGELNATASNAILICHALTGHHHAAGYHKMEDAKAGWWDTCIGPGKPIDTNRFFVVSLNNLGGCHGSTGPTTINPETGRTWGPTFPQVTVKDWVHSQARLADRLGIHQWVAVVGGSLGGMQALQWSITYPNRLAHALVIAAAAKLSAQNIAFNEIARQAILSDPHYQDGWYSEADKMPWAGLALARMVGHITYQSDDGMRYKFGRELKDGDWQNGMDDVQFQVESYLQHQGASFSKFFDANTYFLMTRVLDYFDPAREHDNKLVDTLKAARCRFLLISFTTDWRFSPRRSEEMVTALIRAHQPVSYAVIDDPGGHDAFLLSNKDYHQVLRTYLGRLPDHA